MYFYSGEAGGWSGLVLLFAIAGCIAIISMVLPVGLEASSPTHRSPHAGEEERLFKRFVHGEIDDEEYRRHREVLSGSRPSARLTERP